MTDPDIKVKIIPQLKDNYSYVVYSDDQKLAAIIDPAESTSIIDFIQKKSLTIETIILTHHHDDHTAGVQGILNFNTVSVYSPDKNIFGTSQVLRNNDQINLNFLSFKVLATPGHTLDHLIFMMSIIKFFSPAIRFFALVAEEFLKVLMNKCNYHFNYLWD